MENSALVYIILTAVTVTFGFLVKNRDYTTEYLSGRRSFRGNTSGDLMAAGPDRQQACNAVAEFAIFCLLAGVSACKQHYAFHRPHDSRGKPTFRRRRKR